MKQKKMRTSYAKFIQTGCFNKEKFIEEQPKVLSDMKIEPTETEIADFWICETPRQIEQHKTKVITNHWG